MKPEKRSHGATSQETPWFCNCSAGNSTWLTAGGICLVHHDGFLLWDSKVNRWNSKNMGPKRDIYGEIAEAVAAYDDMKLLATFQHGRTYGYPFGFLRKEGITDQMRRT